MLHRQCAAVDAFSSSVTDLHLHQIDVTIQRYLRVCAVMGWYGLHLCNEMGCEVTAYHPDVPVKDEFCRNHKSETTRPLLDEYPPTEFERIFRVPRTNPISVTTPDTASNAEVAEPSPDPFPVISLIFDAHSRSQSRNYSYGQRLRVLAVCWPLWRSSAQ